MAKTLTFLGTDTEVGKTYQACRLAEALRHTGMQVGVYKPVCSGTDEGGATDADRLKEAAGFEGAMDWVCPQFFRAPLAPPIAAQREGLTVDEDLMLQGVQRWQDYDCLLVETAGGLLSPISETMTCCDLAAKLAAPVVLVVPNRLGMVNQALMALEVISHRDLDLLGLLINSGIDETGSDLSRTSNRDLLSKFSQVRVFSTGEELLSWFQ